jgi:hypothetical protein
MKFKEGEEYTFSVLKIVEIPDEGTFYLLHHTSGRRLLLQYETYKKYSIEVGGYLECRIDKVNCTGKIFLEPRHPKYIEGNIYVFTIIKNSCEEDKTIDVIDCLKNVIKVEVPEGFALYNNIQEIELTVTKLKRGIPILNFPSIDQNRYKDFIGKSLVLRVIKITINNFSDEVFVLQNESVPRAELKVQHYRSYGFNVGHLVEVTVLAVKEDGSLKVEPKNPFYELGKDYEFRITKFKKSELNSKPIVIVEDNTGSKIGIPILVGQLKAIKDKTQLLCRVIGFRKGKPKLSLINC